MPTPQSVIFKARYSESASVALQQFLKSAAGFSGRELRKYFFKRLIRVNGRPAHSAAIINPGDQILVYRMAEASRTLEPEALPLDICYENEDFLVIDKPAGLPVHPSGSVTTGTLAHRVAYYFEQKGLKLKVRPVNRLDQGTSGLILFAKKASSQALLSAAIGEHTISRIYYAITAGFPPADQGTISLPLGMTGKERCVAPDGKPAQTDYKVMEKFARGTLLELNLKTGRTHQIRIHLRHIGCPIWGDLRYGSASPWIRRPALHAGKLNFARSGWAIPELSSPLPEDMRQLLAKLREMG